MGKVNDSDSREVAVIVPRNLSDRKKRFEVVWALLVPVSLTFDLSDGKWCNQSVRLQWEIFCPDLTLINVLSFWTGGPPRTGERHTRNTGRTAAVYLMRKTGPHKIVVDIDTIFVCQKQLESSHVVVAPWTGGRTFSLQKSIAKQAILRCRTSLLLNLMKRDSQRSILEIYLARYEIKWDLSATCMRAKYDDCDLARIRSSYK